MGKLAQVSGLIGTIYDAVLDPRHWQDVLADMSQLLDAKAAAIQMFDPLNGNKMRLSMEYGTDPRWSELLHTTFAALCPIGPILLLAELDEPRSIFNFIDEPEYLETRFFKEWCAPQDYYDMAGSIIVKSQGEVGTLSLMRGRDKPKFNANEMELVGIIAPHVRRAVTIAGLFEHRAIELAGLTSLMQKLSTAIMLVDATGRLIKANGAAEALLSDGAMVRLEGERLVLGTIDSNQGLSEALSTCNGSPAIVPISVGSHARLTAAIVSMDVKHQTFAILIHAPLPTMPAMGKPLVQAFGFTPRELAVLMPVLEGKSASEIAALLGVSVATVRTHLSRLMDKTKTARQTDLIRSVMQVMSPINE